MGSFFADNPYPQDFNLGGFQQSGGPMGTEHGYGTSISGDPRVTTQPQPYQQGPDWNAPYTTLDPNKPQGTPRPMPSGPTPDDPNYDWNTNPWGQEPGGITGWGAGGSRPLPSGGLQQGPSMRDVFMPQAQQGQPGFIQQQMNQNGGFYAPPAITGNSGMSGVFGNVGNPANPGQQNQTLMQSPDGQHFQYVNQEHVPHYQGLGATIHNGSSYGV